MRLFILTLSVLFSGFCVASNDMQQTGNELRYAIQLGASTQPNLAKYKSLKRYGHLYSVDANNGMQRIMLGKFTSRTKADKALKSVKAKGFKDAFVSGGKVSGNKVYTVQYASYLSTDKINWNKLQEIGTAQIDAADGKIKVLSGTFSEKATADEHARGLRGMGYKDAFVRQVNEGTLLNVGTNYSSGEVIISTSVSSGSDKGTLMENLPIYSKLSTYERDNIVLLDGRYHIKLASNNFVLLSDYTPGTIGGVVTTSQPTVVARSYDPVVTIQQPTTTTSTVYTSPTTKVYTGTGGGTVISSTVSSAPVGSTDYRIQLAAVRNYDSTQYGSVQPYGNVTLEPTGNGLNRVMLGNFSTVDEARAVLNSAKSTGFPGAYILRYDSGVRGGKVN